MDYRKQVINKQLKELEEVNKILKWEHINEELVRRIEQAISMIKAAEFDDNFVTENGHGQENEDFEDFIKVVMDDFGSDSVIIKLEDKNWGVQGIHINEYGDIDAVADGIAYYRAKKKNWEDK